MRLFPLGGMFIDMKLARMSITLLLLLFSISLFAQGVYLPRGQNGFGAEARVIWNEDGFEATDVTAGYSIAGILDVGAGITCKSTEFGGSSATDLRFAIDYRVNVLKQSARVPISVQIMGSYGLNDVTGEYLETNNARRRGTGYTIGLDVSRYIRLARFLRLHLNALVDYESVNYITTVIVPGSVDYLRNLYYGGGGGFLFVFPKGQTLAVRAEVRADQDMKLHIQPIIGVAFPQN